MKDSVSMSQSWGMLSGWFRYITFVDQHCISSASDHQALDSRRDHAIYIQMSLMIWQEVELRPEKAMVPHSSTLAWKIPWMEEPGRLQSMGSLRVGHNWGTSLSCIGEGNGNPLQCSCLENPRDGGAWWLPSMGSHRVGYDWSDLAVAELRQ